MLRFTSNFVVALIFIVVRLCCVLSHPTTSSITPLPPNHQNDSNIWNSLTDILDINEFDQDWKPNQSNQPTQQSCKTPSPSPPFITNSAQRREKRREKLKHCRKSTTTIGEDQKRNRTRNKLTEYERLRNKVKENKATLNEKQNYLKGLFHRRMIERKSYEKRKLSRIHSKQNKND